MPDGANTPETAVDRESSRVSTQPGEPLNEKKSQLPRVGTALHPAISHASTYTMHLARPPPLNYTAKTPRRERVILAWFTLFFVEAGVLPLILFFAIRWGTNLSITTNLAIITSLIGSVSGYKFALRQWLMYYKRDHELRRPIGAGRWGIDFTQILFGLSMAAFFLPLIIGSSVHPANPRVVAMALPLTMITLTLPMLLTGLFPHKIRMPLRISSFPKYEPLPPLVYTFIEDIVAVDGDGGTTFRQAWRTRYEESIIMRRIVRYMSLLWGASGCLFGAALVVCAWETDTDVGYGVCYGLPWLWGMLFAAGTIWWVHRQLLREEREWVAPEVHKEHMLPIREGRYDRPSAEITRPSMAHTRPSTMYEHGSALREEEEPPVTRGQTMPV